MWDLNCPNFCLFGLEVCTLIYFNIFSTIFIAQLKMDMFQGPLFSENAVVVWLVRGMEEVEWRAFMNGWLFWKYQILYILCKIGQRHAFKWRDNIFKTWYHIYYYTRNKIKFDHEMKMIFVHLRCPILVNWFQELVSKVWTWKDTRQRTKN